MLKLRVKTLYFQPKLTRFQIDCGFKTLLGIPLLATFYVTDCLRIQQNANCCSAGGQKLQKIP